MTSSFIRTLQTHQWPNCEIQVGRRRLPVTARPTHPDDPGHARRLDLADRVDTGRYAGYEKTSRPQAIVELLPR